MRTESSEIPNRYPRDLNGEQQKALENLLTKIVWMDDYDYIAQQMGYNTEDIAGQTVMLKRLNLIDYVSKRSDFHKLLPALKIAFPLISFAQFRIQK